MRISSNQVKAIDVTGAGDALSAGVLWGQLQGLPLDKSCEAGMQIAGETILCNSSVWKGLCPQFMDSHFNNINKTENAC